MIGDIGDTGSCGDIGDISNTGSTPDGAVEIIACTNGPLLVRGRIDLRSSSGAQIVQSRPTVALCRCGVSTIKPFCDGTHKLVNFRA
ncbi:MAG: CDGSH iron-sulfur domain-containing protein [Rhodoglobus sp.]